ncbi:MAG: hypothetical protein EBX52_12960, partial [Proteobacteria bacterium]|nr:hypothetical protein [Pseudomonadota bacterium]
MISRFISKEIRASKKSILLLGPRQVGKSTLVDSCKPDLHINLADESEFFNYSTQPGAFRSLIEKSSFRTISVD